MPPAKKKKKKAGAPVLKKNFKVVCACHLSLLSALCSLL
jgi:hypothetical protein